jgi:hypothetical protein
MTQPPPLPVAGYCGRCGRPFTSASGAFCGHCGNPLVAQQPVATGYTYPVAPPTAVPGMHRKLPRSRLWIIGGGAVAALVVVISVVAVAARPVAATCHFSCARQQGQPLVGRTTYRNAKFGYSVEYLGSTMSISGHNDSGVTFATQNGSVIGFTASSGTDVDAGIQTAIDRLDSNVFQDLQPVGSVRGAEIGLVLGHGAAYKGNYIPPGGGNSVPIAVLVMSATQNNITVTTIMFSPYSTDVANQPYGLTEGTQLDYPITLTHFPG